MVPLHRTDWQPNDGPVDAGSFTPAQGHNMGLAQWVAVHGPSWQFRGTGGGYLTDYAFLSTFAPTYDTTLLHYNSWGNASNTLWPEVLLRVQRLDVGRRLLRGDFYPLTPWSVEEEGWMAWQYVRSDILEHSASEPVALLQAFRRAGSQDRTQAFALHGLDNRTEYRVARWNDDSGSVMRRNGAQLAEGLELQIDTLPGAEMLLIFGEPSVDVSGQVNRTVALPALKTDGDLASAAETQRVPARRARFTSTHLVGVTNAGRDAGHWHDRPTGLGRDYLVGFRADWPGNRWGDCACDRDG